MTPTLLLPSREEPDGTKAPHCCPLTQDHQGHSSEGEGAGGKDRAVVGRRRGSIVCVCVCVRGVGWGWRGSAHHLKHNRVIGLGPI